MDVLHPEDVGRAEPADRLQVPAPYPLPDGGCPDPDEVGGLSREDHLARWDDLSPAIPVILVPVTESCFALAPCLRHGLLRDQVGVSGTRDVYGFLAQRFQSAPHVVTAGTKERQELPAGDTPLTGVSVPGLGSRACADAVTAVSSPSRGPCGGSGGPCSGPCCLVLEPFRLFWLWGGLWGLVSRVWLG